MRLASTVINVTSDFGVLTGSYDLTFPDGHLSGTFDVSMCDEPVGTLTPVCG